MCVAFASATMASQKQLEGVAVGGEKIPGDQSNSDVQI
jgi:hypothetical protein